MATAKPWIVICWLCRVFVVASGQRAAERECDSHALAKHKRREWDGFMECESFESAVETRSWSIEELTYGMD